MEWKSIPMVPEGLARSLPDGIRSRLVFLIALALLPMLILLTWISYNRFETRRDEELQIELEVARGIATTFAAFVDGVQQQNYTLGQAIVTDRTYSEKDAIQLLTAAAAHYPAVRNLSWVDPGGKVLVSSLKALDGRDLSVRSYFREIATGRPWAIGDLTPSGVSTDAPTLAIATAIRDGSGKLVGAVVAGIEPARLGELILTQDRPAEGAYTLFDRQGTVVFASSGELLTWEARTGWQAGDLLLQM